LSLIILSLRFSFEVLSGFLAPAIVRDDTIAFGRDRAIPTEVVSMPIYMRFRVLMIGFALSTMFASGSARAQTPRIPSNEDESKAGDYTLPDPLVLQNGSKVNDAETWIRKRRPEIVRLFETNMHGRSPGRPEGESFDVFDTDAHALGGTAIRKQITIRFDDRKESPKIDVLMYLPEKAVKPVPLVLVLSFLGNEKLAPDPAIRLSTVWDRKTMTKRRADESSRAEKNAYELDQVLARGYGIATLCYTDIEPDFPGGTAYGVRPLFFKPGQTTPAADEWGAIAAWGWGLSRVMDYLETDHDVDAKRVAIVGYSRLGKTVLWAGARDTRFAMVIAGGSGEGGAALSRRNYGETLKHIKANFPYWFCANYQQFADRPADLPVDSHMLISLIAPRPLYLATAEDDRWADPRGEFLAAVAAEPVYRLLGARGLETTDMPPLNRPILHTIGFHYRPGKHSVTRYEWDRYLDFIDMHFSKRSAREN
jgi:hypothetical protein